MERIHINLVTGAARELIVEEEEKKEDEGKLE